MMHCGFWREGHMCGVCDAVTYGPWCWSCYQFEQYVRSLQKGGLNVPRAPTGMKRIPLLSTIIKERVQ